MAATTTQMGSFYSEKLATSELRKYREKGPIPSTRALIEALKAEGVEGATLLDVGGGIGAIQHELLASGVASATRSTRPPPISLRRARRATVAATPVASSICMATSSNLPIGTTGGHRYARPGHQRVSGLAAAR